MQSVSLANWGNTSVYLWSQRNCKTLTSSDATKRGGMYLLLSLPEPLEQQWLSRYWWTPTPIIPDHWPCKLELMGLGVHQHLGSHRFFVPALGIFNIWCDIITLWVPCSSPHWLPCVEAGNLNRSWILCHVLSIPRCYQRAGDLKLLFSRQPTHLLY